MKRSKLNNSYDEHLSLALDPKAMELSFQASFQREYPNHKLTVQNCKIYQVYHKPGKSCKITYRVSGSDANQNPFTNWFFGIMSAKSSKYENLQEKHPAEWPGCGFWNPVSYWPEMNMILYAYPYDPKLPYLGQLLETDFVKKAIDDNITGFGLEKSWKCKDVVIYALKYRFGKRAIIRYDAQLANETHQQKNITFFSKTYDTSGSRYVFEVLRQICDSPACNNGRLNIPSPIAHIDVANTLWQHEWKGENLSRVGRETGWLAFLETGILSQIASLLAALHQVELKNSPLEPGPSPSAVLENVREEIIKILHFLPEKKTLLNQIIKSLECIAAEWDSNVPKTTIHGTFKLSQFLYRNNQLGLIDFDSIALGDPLYDVAEFLSSFEYLRISDHIQTTVIKKYIQKFLTDYHKQALWTINRQRLAFYLVAFILGKIHSSLKKVQSDEIDKVSTAFTIIEEWLEF